MNTMNTANPAGTLPKTAPGGLSALGLKLLAMALMLCDHLWAALPAAPDLLTHIGRIAFPIFAFQIAEGFARTHDRKRYLLRMLAFAALSEVPFDLFYGGTVFYPFHQNVMFTFVLAILLLLGVEKFRKKGRVPYLLAAVAAVLLGYALGTVTMVDYYGCGVVTVLLFYLCRGWKWGWLPELAGLLYLNGEVLAGEELTVFGVTFPEQGLAVLALVPILCYRGRQGPHSRAIQYACYAFYPVHMLVLALVQSLA